MKDFYVIWTYIGNYSKVQKIEAKDELEAAERATYCFSNDFKQKGTVYVFDRSPVYVKQPEPKAYHEGRDD